MVQVLQWRLRAHSNTEGSQAIAISENEFDLLYAEWLSRRGITKENVNSVSSPLHRQGKGKTNLCLNDLKAQLEQILSKLRLTSNQELVMMLDILKSAMNR